MKCWIVLAAALAAGCPKKNDKPAAEPPAKRDGGAVVIAADAAVTGDTGPVVLQPAPPVPSVPAGLPTPPALPYITPETVALGELLFWDTRLSSTGTMSCASCHDPAAGYAGARRQETAAGKPNLRKAPSLVNLAWHPELGWDGRFRGISSEMLASHTRGQLGELEDALAKLRDNAVYQAHFARAATSLEQTTTAPMLDTAYNALAAFVATRYAGDAPWDRYERAHDRPPDVQAGYQLFTGKAQCSVCHAPPLYTDLAYHRMGLIALPDEGRGRVDPAQKGAFKTPSLRGAAQRKGFFHDASAATLDAAIDHHLAGGTGQGADPSIIDPALKKIALSPTERSQLGAFVRALTDERAPAPTKPALP